MSCLGPNPENGKASGAAVRMSRMNQPLSSSHSSPAFVMAPWIERHRQWVLVAALALLHLALAQGPAGWLGRTLMLVHLGLFLLWQPFVRAEARLAGQHVLVMGLVLTPALLLFNWWLVTAWLLLLAGVVGGRVFFHSRRSVRFYYLMALAYLILMLLVVVVPMALPEQLRLDANLVTLALYTLPVLIGTMAALPVDDRSDGGEEAIDLAYSVFLILLLAVVALGGVALTLLNGAGYLAGLFATVLSVALLLLAASWLWSPRAGFSGLGAMASRYMLSVGLPLEQWLHLLADLAYQEEAPDRFMQRACEGMVKLLPWVNGGQWRAENWHGHFGQPAQVTTEFIQGDIHVNLYTRTSLSPTLVWHFNLVAQLLARFYEAKQRDREVREMAYVQAVHETGARLTHDVKNLLQSLNTLVFAAQQENASMDALSGLLRRQLPQIASRLTHTLDKLKAPSLEIGASLPAAGWWARLQERYGQSGIEFQVEGNWQALSLPENLFFSAVENLLQNALNKRQVEPDIRIVVCLKEVDGQAMLTVCDNGSPVPAAILGDLGTRPVVSENGLGIGLYQLARSASLNGYTFTVRSNLPGQVCFELAPSARA